MNFNILTFFFLSNVFFSNSLKSSSDDGSVYAYCHIMVSKLLANIFAPSLQSVTVY